MDTNELEEEESRHTQDKNTKEPRHCIRLVVCFTHPDSLSSLTAYISWTSPPCSDASCTFMFCVAMRTDSPWVHGQQGNSCCRQFISNCRTIPAFRFSTVQRVICATKNSLDWNTLIPLPASDRSNADGNREFPTPRQDGS